nr:gamma-glutamylcyclotransferase family protein [Motilibacter aurantiacus]
MTERLFSYGTLQDPAVQRATFGRELATAPAVLPGFRTGLLRITNPEVVRTSGSAEHPVLLPSTGPADEVVGSVLELTAEELAAADAYEAADYVRAAVTLRSGDSAWAYLARDGVA